MISDIVVSDCSREEDYISSASKSPAKRKNEGLKRSSINWTGQANSENQGKFEIFKNQQMEQPDHEGGSSSIGSTIGGHLGTIRALIVGARTPIVLKAAYVFGAMIVIMNVVSILVTFSILRNRYQTLAEFAFNSAYPAFMDSVAGSFYLTLEIMNSVQLQLLNPAMVPFWIGTAQSFGGFKSNILYNQYREHVLNFNIESIMSHLKLDDLIVEFDFPDSDMFDRNASFHEANLIMIAYVEKMTNIDYFSGTVDLNLVTFMRDHYTAYSGVMNYIREELFIDMFAMHAAIQRDLNVIIIAGLCITLGAILLFIPVFRNFEDKEQSSLGKICYVKDTEFEQAAKKVTASYQGMFEKNLELLHHYELWKGKEMTRTTPAGTLKQELTILTALIGAKSWVARLQ